MWVRFNKPYMGNKVHDVVDVVDFDDALNLVDNGIAGRCIDNLGKSFEESAPEEVELEIKRTPSPKKSKIKKRQGYEW